jgi:hypothetical protein
VKVGFAKAGTLGKRLATLQIACWEELVLLGTAQGVSEDAVHLQFRHLRVRGEWFRAEPELLTYIERLCGTVSSGVALDIELEG